MLAFLQICFKVGIKISLANGSINAIAMQTRDFNRDYHRPCMSVIMSYSLSDLQGDNANSTGAESADPVMSGPCSGRDAAAVAN